MKYSWKITLAKHFFFKEKTKCKTVAKNARHNKVSCKQTNKTFLTSTQLYLIFVFITCKSSILLHFKMTNTALSQNLPDRLKFKADLTVQSLSSVTHYNFSLKTLHSASMNFKSATIYHRHNLSV